MASPVWKAVGCQLHKLSLISKPALPKLGPQNSLPRGCMMEIAKRNGGGGGGPRNMYIRPAKYMYRSFRDDAHFFLAIALIPCAAIHGYMMAFHGDSELAEIPEGYEPEFWEYQKKPMRRFMAKYCARNPAEEYERKASYAHQQMEKVRYRARRDRYMKTLLEYDDYRTFYFVPALDPQPSIAKEIGKRRYEEFEQGESLSFPK